MRRADAQLYSRKHNRVSQAPTAAMATPNS
jgi:hypothetical protein